MNAAKQKISAEQDVLILPVGDQLYEARIKRKLSLHEVQDALNIKAEYLEALENSNYNALPGVGYVVGFLGTYARFLGMDCAQIIHLYKIQAKPRPAIVRLPAISKPARRSSLLMTVVLLAAIALFYGGWIVVNGNPKPGEFQFALPNGNPAE
ncbi:MAG: helix-turn-helix domain-containing protein [Pseudomonadota bacterium]